MKPKPSECTKHELLEETIRTALKNYKSEVVNIEEGVIFIIEAIDTALKAARMEALEAARGEIQLQVDQAPGEHREDKRYRTGLYDGVMIIDKLIRATK